MSEQPASELIIDTQNKPNGVALITLSGSLDVDNQNADKLKKAIIGLLGEDRARIAIDISRLEYMDSTGLGVLITALKRCREKGGHIAIAIGENRRIYRIFEITGLTKIFDILENTSDAVECALTTHSSTPQETQSPEPSPPTNAPVSRPRKPRTRKRSS